MRIYEQVFGWYAGLDSFAPEFTTYWMTILYIEEPVELISFLALVGWMWKTRDKDIANVQPREEMRRIFTLLQWILVYGVAIYWGASYFTEQDGTWHMTVIRDTDFTPSHIIEFYMSYPMYIVIGVGGFMYARTRLPTFACKGWSIALAAQPFRSHRGKIDAEIAPRWRRVCRSNKSLPRSAGILS